MKNVIKRIGVVFIYGPIFLCLICFNMVIWLSSLVWGPFYYIITGRDPLSIEFDLPLCFTNWYYKKFGPNEH